jgi:hypothetical protein
MERRSDVRNSVRAMRKRNPEHNDGVCRTASHSPFAHAIRALSIFARTVQCAAGITIFIGNVLYQAIIVVLFDGEVDDHGLGKYFNPKKITRPMNSSLANQGALFMFRVKLLLPRSGAGAEW